MACIVKVGNKFENLSGYNTYITDKDINSRYFKINKFEDTFTAGKNLFTLEGSECLKESTELKIEIVDSDGGTLYVEPGRGVPDYYEGNSVVLSSHVYETTPVGPAKITILAELKDYFDEDGIKRPVPEEWVGAYNVKWEKDFFINRNEINKTPVIFYKKPQISIEEVESNVVQQTFTQTVQTGSIIGRAENPPLGTDLNTWRAGTLYRLERRDGLGFKSAMDENTINIPSLGYEGRVKEVINSNTLLVDRPFIDSNNRVINNLSNLDYSINFTDFGDRTSNNSSVTASFGRIKLSRLDTFTGNVDKMKVFKKSRSDVGNFKFQDEIKIVAGNLLRDPLIPGSDLDGGFGRLTESNVETYWETSSIQISGSNSTVSGDDDNLFESIRINIPSSSVATSSIDLVTNTVFDIYDDVDYELNFRTLVSGAFEDIIPGEITVVSESYTRTHYYKYDPSKLTLFEPTYTSQSSYTELEAPGSESINLTKPLIYDNSRVSFYDTPPNPTGSVYTSIPSGYTYNQSHDTTLTFDTTSGDWGTNSRVQSDSDDKTNIVAHSGSFSGEFNLVVWLDSGSFTLPTGGSPTDVRTIIETYDSGSTRIALLGLQNIGTDAKFYYKHSSTELDELESFRTSTEYSLENIDTNDYNDSSVVSTFNTGSQTIIDYNDGGYHYVHIDYRTLRNIEPLNANLINVNRLDELDGDVLYGATYEISSMNFETGIIEFLDVFSNPDESGTMTGTVSMMNGQTLLTIGSDSSTVYMVELDFQEGILVFKGKVTFADLEPAIRGYDLYDLFDLSGSNWSSTGSNQIFVPRVPPQGGDYLYSDSGYPYSPTSFSDRNFLTTEFTSPSSSDDDFTNPLEVPYIFKNDGDIIENVYVEDSDQIYVVSSVSSSTDINNTNYVYDQELVFSGFFFTGSVSGTVYVNEAEDSNTNKQSLSTYNSLITSHIPISSSIGDFNIILLTDSGSSAVPTNTGSIEFQIEYYQSGSILRAATALRNVETDAMFFYNNSATSQSVLESYSGSTNIILDSIDSGDFENTPLWFLSTGSQAIFDLESGSNSHFIYIDYRENRNSEPLNADLNEITAISQIGTNNFLPLKAREVFPFSGSTDITGSVTSTDYYTSQLPLVAGNYLYTFSDYPFIPASPSDGTYVTDDVDPTTDITIPDTLFEIPYVFDTVDGKIENVYVKEFDDIYTASSDNGTGITTFTEPPVITSSSLQGPDTIVAKTITAFITGSYPSGGLDNPFNEELISFRATSEFNSRQQIQHLFTMPYSGSGKLGFSFRGDGWQLSKVNFQPSQDVSFSPKVFDVFDEQDRNLPSETFDYKFELYDVNNNYIPVELLASKEFTGGNKVNNEVIKILTFESDKSAFRFYSGSLANPPFQQIKFNYSKTDALSGQITFASSAYDKDGNYIEPGSYTGDYPGMLTSVSNNNALLTIANFSGSDSSYEVSSIVYTASVDNKEEYETIIRLEDGQPVADLVVNNDRSVFTYRLSDGSLNPTEQNSRITVKRKNLASNVETITANSSSLSGSAPPLTLISDDSTTGVATYFLSGSTLNLSSGSISYEFTSSDEFGVQIDNVTTVTPISFLEGVVLYLTNERGVLPAFYSGVIPSASYQYTSGSTKLYVGGDEVTFDNGGGNNTYKITGVTGSGITPNEVNPTTNEYGGIPGTMGNESSSLEINVQYTDSIGESYDFGRTANFNLVREGEQGQPGLEGSNGPGLVFTGIYDNTRNYTVTTGSLARRDSIIYNDVFYLAVSESGPSTSAGLQHPSSSTDYWSSLGTGSNFVAAGLAVFSESYVQNNINVGTNNSGSASAANITIAGGTNYPYFSIDQGATTGTQGYNVGNGIFLGINGNTGTGSFSIENGLLGDELLWDGSSLTIRGSIEFSNTPGAITDTLLSASLFSQDAATSASNAQSTADQVNTDLADVISGTTALEDGNSNTFIDSGIIYSPNIGGTYGYFSNAFRVGEDGITLDGLNKQIYIGAGNYGEGDTGFFVSSSGEFSLGDKFVWDGSVLNISGSITANQGSIAGFEIESDVLKNTNNTFEINTIESGSLKFFDGETESVTISNSGVLRPFTGSVTTPSFSPSTTDAETSSSLNLGGTSGITGYLSIYNSNIVTSGDTSPASFTAPSNSSGLSATIGCTISPANTHHINSVISPGSGATISGHNVSATLVVQLKKDGTVIQTKTQPIQGSTATTTNTVGGNYTIAFNSINLDEGAVYTLDTGIQSRSGYLYGSAGSDATSWGTAYFYPPDLSSPTISIEAPGSNSFTEITRGGVQVISSETKAVIIPTSNSGDALSVTGSISATGNITAFSTSDERLKENIIPIPLALDKVNELNGVTFDWKDGYEDVHQFEGEDIGVIAQDVEKVIPHITNVNKQHGYYGVKYEKLTPLLIEAIKELSQKVNDLEKEIKRLKG